jgi:hypothetical protein
MLKPSGLSQEIVSIGSALALAKATAQASMITATAAQRLLMAHPLTIVGI